MAEMNLPAANQSKKGVKKLVHASTRVDLTPMVDLGFLLVTFFVFTTTMSTSTTMDLVEPIDSNERPVPQSGSITFLLGHNSVFYYDGLFEKEKVQPIAMSELRKLVVEKKKSTDIDKLMVIIKSSDSATFANNIDLLDEMTICNVPKGHYAEAELLEAEKAFLQKQ